MEGAEALRPDWEVGYCFRVDGRGERVPVLRSEEEEKYVRPGFQRLKKGEIVPRCGKKAQVERGSDAAANASERKSNSGPGSKRKWIYAPLGDGTAEPESRGLKRVKRDP